MNKFTSIIKISALVCGLSVGYMSASLEEKQSQYLEYIEGKIQSYVVFSTQWPQNFLDIRNKESYAKHINRFKEALVSFEKDVLASLQSEKSNADTTLYGQAITLTYDIVSTLYSQAKHVHTILEKHRGKPNAIALGNDLRAVEKYTQPDIISGLQSKLKRLQTIFNTIYQSLATKIASIIDSLEQRKLKKMNMVESFQALTHRVSCKN
jgi:hypothetical protein